MKFHWSRAFGAANPIKNRPSMSRAGYAAFSMGDRHARKFSASSSPRPGCVALGGASRPLGCSSSASGQFDCAGRRPLRDWRADHRTRSGRKKRKRLIVRTDPVRSAGFIKRADHRRPSSAVSVTPATARGKQSKNIKRAIATRLTQDNRGLRRVSGRDRNRAAHESARCS
jgi:hypothetical protein